MQKKLLFILNSALITLFYYHLTSDFYRLAHAASPSPSPSPLSSPASINEVTENLKKRLQDSLEDIPAAPPTSAISYVGIVKDIIKDTVIIEDKDGKRDIKLKDDTQIFRAPGNTAIKAENIRIDDYIIAIGYPEGENLSGRRLIVSADPIKPPAKATDMGTITQIGKAGLTLSVRDQEQALLTTVKTIYKSTTGTIESTDLSVGDTVIYTATLDKNSALTATHLMRILSSSLAQ